MTIAIVDLPVRPESVDEAVNILNTSLEATRGHAGCSGADVLEGDDEPGVLVPLERWETADDQKQYVEWRAGPGADDTIAPLVVAPPVIRVFDKSPVV